MAHCPLSRYLGCGDTLSFPFRFCGGRTLLASAHSFSSYWPNWLNKRSGAVQPALAKPVSYFNTGIAYLSIPAGLLGYLFLFASSYLGWVLYGLIALLYTHIVLINRIVKVAVHLALIHLGVVWSLCFFSFLDLKLFPGAPGKSWQWGDRWFFSFAVS